MCHFYKTATAQGRESASKALDLWHFSLSVYFIEAIWRVLKTASEGVSLLLQGVRYSNLLCEPGSYDGNESLPNGSSAHGQDLPFRDAGE
jgi:hypothetical protein